MDLSISCEFWVLLFCLVPDYGVTSAKSEGFVLLARHLDGLLVVCRDEVEG